MIRKLAIALVALVALGGTVTAFAWWDQLQDSSSETVEIGENATLTVPVSTHTANQTLIPSGNVLGPNDTYSYVFTYDVSLSKDVTTPLTLTVAEVVDNSVVINGNTYTDLIDVDVALSAATIDLGSNVTVTVTVTFLREPADQTEYDLVAGFDIAFDLVFTAVQ